MPRRRLRRSCGTACGSHAVHRAGVPDRRGCAHGPRAAGGARLPRSAKWSPCCGPRAASTQPSNSRKCGTGSPDIYAFSLLLRLPDERVPRRRACGAPFLKICAQHTQRLRVRTGTLGLVSLSTGSRARFGSPRLTRRFENLSGVETVQRGANEVTEINAAEDTRRATTAQREGRWRQRAPAKCKAWNAVPCICAGLPIDHNSQPAAPASPAGRTRRCVSPCVTVAPCPRVPVLRPSTSPISGSFTRSASDGVCVRRIVAHQESSVAGAGVCTDSKAMRSGSGVDVDG